MLPWVDYQGPRCLMASVIGNGYAPPLTGGSCSVPSGLAAGQPTQFEHGVHLHLATIAGGWDQALVLAVWSSLGEGQNCGQHFTRLAQCRAFQQG